MDQRIPFRTTSRRMPYQQNSTALTPLPLSLTLNLHHFEVHNSSSKVTMLGKRGSCQILFNQAIRPGPLLYFLFLRRTTQQSTTESLDKVTVPEPLPISNIGLLLQDLYMNLRKYNTLGSIRQLIYPSSTSFPHTLLSRCLSVSCNQCPFYEGNTNEPAPTFRQDIPDFPFPKVSCNT